MVFSWEGETHLANTDSCFIKAVLNEDGKRKKYNPSLMGEADIYPSTWGVLRGAIAGPHRAVGAQEALGEGWIREHTRASS